MAAPPTDHQLQKLLQTAVQSVKWTYSLFWQLCPEQAVLVWGDGYYNGGIKTRKTVEAVEVTTEEACLQRSQQLRELYDSLSAGDINQPTRRPSTALSPEDLTESEWFYLMCVSFSFPLGVGLPGRAYEKRQHIWLTGANAVDGKVFCRAILAKSAQVQTVLCIPLLEGVVELGTTERVEEDIEIIQKVKNLFINYHNTTTTNNNQTPKPAVSEHSTASNPSLAISYSHSHPALTYTPTDEDDDHDHADDGNEDQLKADDDDDQLNDEDNNNNNNNNNNNDDDIMMMMMSSSDHDHDEFLMQVDMCESIRLGSSPDDDDLLFTAVTSKLEEAESTTTHDLHAQLPSTHNTTLQILAHTETPPAEHDQLPHYSQTVSSILQRQSLRRCSNPCNTVETSRSAFTAASTTQSHHKDVVITNNERTSQCLLKHILFTVPLLHTTTTKSQGESATVDLCKQNELSANHVLAERRRREKLNERFIILRSLVPFVTKMDKASILADAIEYVKQLVKRIQDLEASASNDGGEWQRKDKSKMRVVELLPHMTEEVEVEVSIIESDGLVEMRCPWREGLLLDVMQKLREYRMEITTVQSSSNDGVLVAEFRAKVKENSNGKKVSIVEVKRAIKHIIKLF